MMAWHSDPCKSRLVLSQCCTNRLCSQTGSGKTHGIIGYPPQYPGIILLSAEDVFARIAKMKQTDPGGAVAMKVAYLQVYCEVLQDLLVPEKARRKHVPGLPGRACTHMSTHPRPVNTS